MQRWVAVAVVLGVVAFAGCDQLSGMAKSVAKQTESVAQADQQPATAEAPATPAADKPAEAKTEPAPKTSGKADFEGQYITVWIDGQKTRPSGREHMGEPVWVVDACSPNPEIKFEMDKGHLGDLKATDVVINPIKDGKTDPTDLWQCAKARAMKPGVATKLDSFNHIAGGKLVAATKLPPGPYSIKVGINGQKTWDRQTIHVTVK